VEQSQLITVVNKHKCLLCESIYDSSDTDGKSCPNDGSLLIPVDEDPLLGQTLAGKYQIESLIGSGGWSRVYKAMHTSLRKHVAVKVLDAGLVDDQNALRRFEAEAKALYGLVHPGIVAVYDHGVMPYPYIVMELVEGKTLEQIVEERGPLALDLALSVFESICEAMGYAHAAGFIHRDLKPSNIMMDETTSTLKVLDFGLVKSSCTTMTQTGDTVGSPPYMSPEQCRGQTMDVQSDIYSLGCIMYEVVTGTRAFSGETAIECMYKHFTQSPVPARDLRPDLNIPAGLERVIGKSVEVEKKERFASMQELLADLRRVKTGTVKARWNRYKVRYRKSVYTMARISRWGIATIVVFYLILCLPAILVALHIFR
jgi:eukaryotic-like serine/threonine-protein kinase